MSDGEQATGNNRQEIETTKADSPETQPPPILGEGPLMPPPGATPPPLATAPLAYENHAFLNSADGRLIRIVSEYLSRWLVSGESRFKTRSSFLARHVFAAATRPIARSNYLPTPAPPRRLRAKNSRPKQARLLQDRPAICSASARWLRWKWLATTKTRGGWRNCSPAGP